MPATRPVTISELDAITQADPDASPSSNLNLDALFTLRRGAPTGREGTGIWCGRRRMLGQIWSARSDTDLGEESGVRAATLILEKIPSPWDYATVLNEEQRANVTANGEDLLLQLGHPKAMLVERYKRYARSPTASADTIPVFMLPSSSSHPSSMQQPQKASQQVCPLAQHAVTDEAARWRAQHKEAAAGDSGLPSASASG
ncbi:hypothetical protein B0H10DRAFT_2208326 [Mycena sp. CBHHK59/15]|nr:hypothetical protein B0H10DRAFT_2208326 [Mycena sp. CBHHK59/15]